MWSIPTHLNTENSLQHWITYTYSIDTETVATEAAVCTVCHRGYYKLPTFFNKIFEFLIYSFFFIQFYTIFDNFHDIHTKGMKSLSHANTWNVVWFFL